MLTLPGLTIPSDRALRAAVRRIIGMPGAIVMIGPVVNRAAALVALLDQPRDLYLCHDFGPAPPEVVSGRRGRFGLAHQKAMRHYYIQRFEDYVRNL